MKWIDNRSSLQLNIGQGYGKDRTKLAEAKGYVIAQLGKSNGTRQLLLTALIRLVAEFRLRGMPRPDVVTCMHSVLPQSRFVLPSNW